MVVFHSTDNCYSPYRIQQLTFKTGKLYILDGSRELKSYVLFKRISVFTELTCLKTARRQCFCSLPVYITVFSRLLSSHFSPIVTGVQQCVTVYLSQ